MIMGTMPSFLGSQWLVRSTETAFALATALFGFRHCRACGRQCHDMSRCRLEQKNELCERPLHTHNRQRFDKPINAEIETRTEPERDSLPERADGRTDGNERLGCAPEHDEARERKPATRDQKRGGKPNPKRTFPPRQQPVKKGGQTTNSTNATNARK